MGNENAYLTHELSGNVRSSGKFGNFWLLKDSEEIILSDEARDILCIKPAGKVSARFVLSKIHPRDRAFIEEKLSRLSTEKSVTIVHRAVIRKKVLWIETSVNRLTEAEGFPVFYAGVFRDITAEKRNNPGAPRRRETVLLRDCLDESLNLTALRDIVENAKKSIRAIANTDMAEVFFTSGGELIKNDFSGCDKNRIFRKALLRSSSLGSCLKTGETVILKRNYLNSIQDQLLLKELGVRTLIHLPVKSGDAVIAVLSLAFSSAVILSKERLAFCNTFCGYLSVQLQNALLIEKFLKELSVRKKIETSIDVLFSDSISLIAIFDTAGRFEKISPNMCKRLGYQQDEFISREYSDFLLPEDRDKNICRAVMSSKKRTVKGYRNRFLCKNGEVIELLCNARFMPEGNCIVTVSRDITDQEKIIAENRELEKNIATEKLKLEFFAQLSHEFKTPLNIILSSLQLMKIKLKTADDESFNREYEKFFGYMEQNSYKLLRLVSNLIDLSRLGSDFLELNLENCDMPRLLSQLVRSVDVYAAARGITLRFTCDITDPLYLYCDKDKIERILLNLLSNAIKNTKPGGEIGVSLSNGKNFVKITVRDTGVGIDPSALPYVFDKFRMPKRSFIQNSDGSGIGLSIVKSLVNAHKGEITVKSRPGEGSVFEFTISKYLNSEAMNQLMLKSVCNDEKRSSLILMEMADLHYFG
ncbi:MAG: ATP-binding protein [Bacillota bacterium]|nr:ATP-binding protein [Bacillota bacterium]